MARRALALVASLGLLAALAVPVTARNVNADNLYQVHRLWSDVKDAAAGQDTDLVNGWGIAASPTSPWWVSDNGTSKSTLYNGVTGAKLGLTVTVPGAPTGIVFNGVASDFKVDAGTGLVNSRFIFATDDGQIAGWNGVGTAAIHAAGTPGAIYLGLAIGSTGGAQFLYAANFPAARVDVFDRAFQPASLAGDFTDPNLPAGYAPFGIQNIGGEIFVAYAKQNADGDEELHGEGLGVVDVFGTDGTFHGRVATFGDLNAPWGLAKAPAGFGKFSGDLLVGNFGDGRIHAFRWTADDGWEAHGVIKGVDHRPISIDGLWGIGFGNGAAAGPTNTLYFASGPDDETHGLFGSITAP
ncbi:MAG TPA: TIGR03118 family protein [Candidatus Deferrimicrobium sp.]|nr:TIGR03118 family protein [Candidatus Deferrimicrobium sp.]